jgi:hypothetical protein
MRTGSVARESGVEEPRQQRPGAQCLRSELDIPPCPSMGRRTGLRPRHEPTLGPPNHLQLCHMPPAQRHFGLVNTELSIQSSTSRHNIDRGRRRRRCGTDGSDAKQGKDVDIAWSPPRKHRKVNALAPTTNRRVPLREGEFNTAFYGLLPDGSPAFGELGR